MFLRTERLFLRPAWLEDVPELTRAIGREAVVRMLARVPWPYGEEHARAWVEQARDPYLPSLLVTLPEDGRIIGGCGLHDGASNDDAIGDAADRPGLLGRRDAEPDTNRQCRCLTQACDRVGELGRHVGSEPCHAATADQIDEPAAVRRDLSHAIERRGRRDEAHEGERSVAGTAYLTLTSLTSASFLFGGRLHAGDGDVRRLSARGPISRRR